MSDVSKSKVIILSLLLISALFLSFKPQSQKFNFTDRTNSDSLVFPGEKHFKNMRMLTNDGDNAEAYFSFDGTKVIFQSTRDEFKCDQIFTMNIDGSNVKLASTGKGRTTCSYWLPDGKHILYASTHLGGDDCPPPPDMSKGYVWGVYRTYDLFTADANGSNVKRLTDADGYDAEATVSPVGDRIIFTSARDGDIDIYSMNLDGTDVKRMTSEIGYDGGANYSYNGKMIVWRANRPKTEEEIKEFKDLLKDGWVRPHSLELYVMNSDGSGVKQLTDNSKANFAPYFFPNDKRIIFCSNMDDPKGRQFDLYAIDTDGSNLEKITYNDTFDGFPMFSMDGKKFIFCSNRFDLKPGQTNVFVCDWVE